MNNLLGTIIDPVIIGKFDQERQIAKEQNRKPPVMLVEIGENRGEKGGLPTSVTLPDDTIYIRLIEKAAWPPAASVKAFKHFNTANYVFSIDGLLDLFGLDQGYDTKYPFGTERFVEQIDRVVRVPHILETEIVNAPIGSARYYVYKAEQALADLTDAAGQRQQVIWLEVDRAKRFAPTKELEDLGTPDNPGTYFDLLNTLLKCQVLLPEPVAVSKLITYEGKVPFIKERKAKNSTTVQPLHRQRTTSIQIETAA